MISLVPPTARTLNLKAVVWDTHLAAGDSTRIDIAASGFIEGPKTVSPRAITCAIRQESTDGSRDLFVASFAETLRRNPAVAGHNLRLTSGTVRSPAEWFVDVDGLDRLLAPGERADAPIEVEFVQGSSGRVLGCYRVVSRGRPTEFQLHRSARGCLDAFKRSVRASLDMDDLDLADVQLCFEVASPLAEKIPGAVIPTVTHLNRSGEAAVRFESSRDGSAAAVEIRGRAELGGLTLWRWSETLQIV